MTEEMNGTNIKVTDRRHFSSTGERREGSDPPAETPSSAGESPNAPSGRPAAAPGKAAPAAESAGRAVSAHPAAAPGKETPAPADTAQAGPANRAAASGRERTGTGEGAHAQSAYSEVAAGISSSFSLLVARLAQETEIYLGLVPYPGKETPEPDLEAGRAMIDILSMLQEKTRGNLDEEESRLIENILYAYRLEFVRRGSGGPAR